jgi:hypothetical protein
MGRGPGEAVATLDPCEGRDGDGFSVAVDRMDGAAVLRASGQLDIANGADLKLSWLRSRARRGRRASRRRAGVRGGVGARHALRAGRVRDGGRRPPGLVLRHGRLWERVALISLRLRHAHHDGRRSPERGG